MFRWLLLFSSLVMVGLGLLTQMRSPEWSQWKLALLADEFGHWLALAALAIALLAWRGQGAAPLLSWSALLLSALALGLLLTPSLAAWKIAGELPGRLARQFGAMPPDRPAFSFFRLFGLRSPAGSAETLVFSPEQHLSLDFYRAVGRTGAAPCVVVVHGGGWDSGRRDEIAHFNHWLAQRGYAVAAIDYRLAPKTIWPAQRDDVLAALAFLKSHAARLGLDPARFVLFGRSAGGNIAESVAYGTPDPAIRGVIAFYAPADLHFAWQYSREDDIIKSPLLMRQFVGGPPDTARAAFDSASPYFHVTPAVPPTLLVHGQLDTLVWHKQSERLAERLRQNQVPHALVSLPWATHAFEYNLSGPGGQLATYATEWFLASVTRDAINVSGN